MHALPQQPNRLHELRGRVPRALVLGLDGATYDALAPLVAAGCMPNLGRLMQRSALAVARSTEPAITPVAWTSFQTGCEPAVHGILDYRYLDHESRRLKLNHTGRIRVPTIFEELSRGGESVVSINLPMTWPPVAGVNGIVVGGLDCPSIAEAMAHCPDFAARVRASGAAFDFANIWPAPPATWEALVLGVARTRADYAARVTAAKIADEMTDWSLLFVQFQTLDTLQHRCWHLLGLDGHDAPSSWIAKAREAYTALDDCIGDLCELAERRGAAIVAVSDHGFGSYRGTINVPELLARRGLLRAPGAAGRVWRRVVRTGWKAKKSLARRLRPHSSIASIERPLDALLPIDWRRSRAVSLHGNLGALLYLNTRERFGGPIASQSARRQALEECRAALAEAVHPETGEPLFEPSVDVAEQFGFDPVEKGWPDLIASPAPGFHTGHKVDPRRRLLRVDPSLSGTHRNEGVLMIQSPGSRIGHSHTIELRDAAPTLLALLGKAPAAAMTGRVCHEMFSTPLPQTEQAASTAQCQTLSPRAIPEDQELVEARLRGLGYID